jgi:hypothetical protein
MEPELPASPIVDRWFAEAPWTVALPLLVAGALLAWWGARNDRARPVMAGVACLLGAAAALAVAALRTSPGEHAAATVRELVRCAEAADVGGIEALLAPDASFHHGSPRNPGQGMDRLMDAVETLRGRHRIDSNDVTRLDLATLGADRGAVVLACRTTTASSWGPVPTRWWIEARRTPSGDWRIDRIAWLAIMDRAPDPSLP